MGDNRSHGWTDERVALLRKHFEENLSASRSGAILGVTRNAVIGKRQRLGLAVDPAVQRSNHVRALQRFKAPPVKPAPEQRPPAAMKPVAFAPGPQEPIETEKPSPKPAPVPAEAKALRIFDHGFGGCRWPIGGEREELRHCCAPRREGEVYCDDHRLLAYQPGKTRMDAKQQSRFAKLAA